MVTIDDVKRHLTADECAALDAAIQEQRVEPNDSPSLGDWLSEQFLWDRTAQGDLFWRAIWHRLDAIDQGGPAPQWHREKPGERDEAIDLSVFERHAFGGRVAELEAERDALALRVATLEAGRARLLAALLDAENACISAAGLCVPDNDNRPALLRDQAG